MDIKTVEIMEQGYCVLEGLFDARECQEMRDRLQTYWRSRGAPSLTGWGFGIHPLYPQIPELGRFLVHPQIMEKLNCCFSEPARIVHAGARLSGDNSANAIDWHVHYSWDQSKIEERTRCERLLAGIYADGSNKSAGPLCVIPRKYNEPIGATPKGDDTREICVETPPGSVVIFDTAVWHRARLGAQKAMRHLFGAHYMPLSDLREHPEDNDVRGLNHVHTSSGVEH